MREEQSTEKKSGGMGEFWQKASGVGKRMADGVSKGTKSIAEKAREFNHEQQLKKYNPLSMDDVKKEGFHIPSIIKIVDDVSRRDIEVCEGAIGWRETVNEVEVLCIYTEFASAIGIQYVPMAEQGEIYCVDKFDETRYLNVSLAFRRATDEKLAELANIAYCLGAKSCSIEIVESDSAVSGTEQKVSGKLFGISAKASQETSSKTSRKTSGKTVKYFEGSNAVRVPELKWFAHDDNIRGLIEMRCSDQNSIKSNVLELSGAMSNTMSRSVACAIDGLMKGKGKIGASMESQASKEYSSKLIFEIEF